MTLTDSQRDARVVTAPCPLVPASIAAHTPRSIGEAFPWLREALAGLIEEFDRQSRYGSPMARAANPRIAAARTALARMDGDAR